MLDEKDMKLPSGVSLMEYSNELYEILAHFQEPYRDAMCSDTKGGIKKALQFKIDNSIKKYNDMRKKEIEMNNVFLPVKFSNRSFQCFYLKGGNFRRAVCDGADFTSANLEGANFSMSQCRETKFIKAICRRSDFNEAHCENSHFNEVQAEGIIFNDAHCNKANFSRSFIPGAFFVQAYCNTTNFWKSNVRGSNFSNAHCHNADFSDCLGEDTKFWKAQCKDANFGESRFDNADFSDANCDSASFWMTNLVGTDFSDAHCMDCDFSSANCQEADFTNANIKNSKMNKKTNLFQCWFYGTEIEGSKLKFAIKSFFKSDKELLPFPEERDAKEAATPEEAKEKLEESRTIYLEFKNYLTTQGMYTESSEFFIREREMNRKLIRYRIKPWGGFTVKKDDKLPAWKYYLLMIYQLFEWMKENIEDEAAYYFYTVLYHFGRYGEKPHYIVGWSTVMIIFFGVLYGIGGGVKGIGNEGFINAARNYVYFSIVTFTTLGYGDLQPLGWWRLVAGLEAVFGAFAMAYFVVSWMRKVTH